MKTIELKASKLPNYSVLWSTLRNPDDYALQLDAFGKIDVKVDRYGLGEETGSGRAALLGDVSIKGIGATPLVRAGASIAYSSGIQNAQGAVIETVALATMNHLVGGIEPLGAIFIDDVKHPTYLNDLPEQYRKNNKVKTNKALLLREAPDRMTHYCIPELKDRARFFFTEVRRHHCLETENFLEIANYFLHLVVYKRTYLDMLRFKVFDGSIDNLDVRGNVFDLPTSGFAAGLTNGRYTGELLQRDYFEGFIRHLYENTITHFIQPDDDTAIDYELVLGYLYNGNPPEAVVKGLVERSRTHFAPMLLGLDNNSVPEIRAQIGEAKFRKKMKLLGQFIFSDTAEVSWDEYMMFNDTKGSVLPELIKMLTGDVDNLRGNAKRVYGNIKDVIALLKPWQVKNALNILGERVTMFGHEYVSNPSGYDDQITFSLVCGTPVSVPKTINECIKDTKTLPTFYECITKRELMDMVHFDPALLD